MAERGEEAGVAVCRDFIGLTFIKVEKLQTPVLVYYLCSVCKMSD